MITGICYGIVASTKTRVRCVFCGVYIPKASKCIEEHINGAKHKENMELVYENGISYDSSRGLYCKLCATSFEGSIVQHLEMDDHANYIATLEDLTDGEYIHVDAFLAGQTDVAFCSTCQVTIPCTLHNIEAHVNEDFHIMETLKPLNGLFSVDNPLELWCKVCDVYIDNTTPGVLEHSEDDDHHVNWFKKMEPYTANNGISIGNYLTHEFENKVYCLRCKAEILCNTESIDYHIQTDAHMSAEPHHSEISDLQIPPD
ncbi:uncharacterized protein [Epargyreus clarus]|uniref:uncharacterized protein n=1 Tax=Epargyreus clarus TaxID=520877 RepID=UPI003C2C880F